ESAARLRDHRVSTGDGHVVEEDVAVGRTSDRRPVAAERERLSGAAPSRADDEGRPLDALDPGRRLLGDLVGRVGQRLLRVAALVLEHGPAAGAEVRGLRVLEAAFGAVDVAHSTSGADFRARISLSWSTSTWASSSSDFPRLRATRSALRMSI